MSCCTDEICKRSIIALIVCPPVHYASIMVFWWIPGKADSSGTERFWPFPSCGDITGLLSFTRCQQKVTGLWVLVKEKLLIWAREDSPLPGGNKRDWTGHIKVTSVKASLLITPKEFLCRYKCKESKSKGEFPPMLSDLLFWKCLFFFFSCNCFKGPEHL